MIKLLSVVVLLLAAIAAASAQTFENEITATSTPTPSSTMPDLDTDTDALDSDDDESEDENEDEDEDVYDDDLSETLAWGLMDMSVSANISTLESTYTNWVGSAHGAGLVVVRLCSAAFELMATSKASHRAGLPQEEPCSSWYKPPARRLQDALQECAEIDHELKVLETSGHTRVGAFAKTLAMKPKIGTKLRSSSGNEEPKDLSDDDEDASTDPFINQFYDDQGRTLSEQLLRGRMRVLALVKLIHGHHSISKAHAELELGETYARMNLWKQAELHASCAANLLREIEISSQKEKGSAKTRGQKDNGKLLRLALEFCYEAQCDEAARGRVSADELLVHLNKDGEAGSHNQLVAAVFARGVLEKAFESNQSLHWQKLLLRLEEISEELHQHLTFVSARLAPGVAQMLNALFVSLDTAEDGIVPFHTFLDRLQTANTDLSNCKSSSASYIQALCGTLQRVLNRVCYHSLTWTEILTLGANNNLRLPSSDDSRSDDDSLPALLARVKLLLSRVYLRRGQLEDAVRYVQAAVVARERIYAECSDLVPFYLVAAEAQARRGRQLRVLGQQARRDRSERWLQTTKALGIYDLERWKSTNRPGNDNEASARSLMDEALESCNKAWELQERHFGREHVATAAVHVSLAQVHLLRSINEDRASADEEKEAVHEAICCFTAAIDIYENACSGTVPASAFLRLELAKLYQQDQLKRDKARAEYEFVGRFFATFAAEFAGSESTKRECAALALDAFRQWITLSRNSTTSLDDQRFVLKEMNSVSVNGYGEFSIEACESAAQLARMLHRIATSRAVNENLRARSTINYAPLRSC
ncbi:Tetratricopeptide-like helical domain [Phytophthora cactorum]|nr:Tetratricopeptide-like helical domain [Phytophthora cactorum]